jgi:hypothetical protein
MNIESAAYVSKQGGAIIAIRIVHDDGQERDAPVDREIWINDILKEWIEAGNEVATTSSPSLEDEVSRNR